MSPQAANDEEALFFDDFDLSQIFIGREQQLDLFRVYLERWQRQISTNSSPTNILPSPNDKIQGLVVLLHGRGGFGKSVLLKHYHEIALEDEQELKASTIVDWEFAISGKRALFSPAPSEEVDAFQYFSLLRDQLANALKKRSEEFREYQVAVKDVEEAKRRARGVLESLQGDDRYSWLRGLAGEGVLALVRLIPHSQIVLNQEKITEKIKAVAGEGAQIGVEQIRQVWTRLHENLGAKLSDYLEQATRLGQGIGNDLAHFAKKLPMLLFFDTYEEIDEADELLRIVMGAASERVGWVIAGRDNLWAGSSQRLRSQDTIYGYKDIVLYSRGLSVDFSADGVGDFILSDVQQYFAELCKIPRQPPLPILSEKDAEHLLYVTKGVPLALKIAASLYLEKPDLKISLEGSESKREIVDQMVRRYLLHTRTNEADRARLYGLALLRRAEEPRAIATALDLPRSTDYSIELSRLHRRYGFVFTRQEQPALHQEVRYFLRLWLLEHRAEPIVAEVSQKLKETHQLALQELETARQYTSLQARLEDEQWVNYYLDFTEQYFWLDPAQGVICALAFMAAASIYYREANREIFTIGMFFETVIPLPYRRYWTWAAQSLRYITSHNPFPEELSGLQDLVKLAGQGIVAFIAPLPDAQKELEAALWARLGEAYHGKQENQAIYWYQKALDQLLQETGKSEEEIKSLLNAGIDEKKHEINSSLDGVSFSKSEGNDQHQGDNNAVSPLQRPLISSIAHPKKQQRNRTPSQKGLRNQQLFSRRAALIGGVGAATIIASTFVWQTRPQWLAFFSRSSPSTFSAIPKVTPSPSLALTPPVRLEQNPHTFSLAVVNVYDLLNGSSETISDIKRQVRAQPIFQNRSVAFTNVYGGAPDIGSVQQALEVADRIYSILQMLGQEGFAFQRSVYSQPLYDLGIPANEVRVEVYLFAD